MALAGNLSKAYNGIKLKEAKCHVRRNWFNFYQNESQKVFAKAYRWMCFENKFKLTKDNISNYCSQDTDSNDKRPIYKFSLVFSKAKSVLLNENFTYRSKFTSLQLLMTLLI